MMVPLIIGALIMVEPQPQSLTGAAHPPQLATGAGSQQLATGAGSQQVATGAGSQQVATGAGSQQVATGAGSQQAGAGSPQHLAARLAANLANKPPPQPRSRFARPPQVATGAH